MRNYFPLTGTVQCQENEVFGPPCINVRPIRVVSIANASVGPTLRPGAVSLVLGWLKLFVRNYFPLTGTVQCQEYEVFGPPCINVSAYKGGIYCKRKCWTNTSPCCS